MFCYNCGRPLSEHDFCTSCGADVSLYKKILSVSNRFYNEGLEKASVRDLSGAIVSLRQSLKFNKNNVDARNLLGLVYFETGEVVAALSEWVISKNLRPEKNIADDYITMVQSNGTRLDSINQTIKKYNQALVYCMQDSKDLAVIQLKKVLSLNPKFVRAHQLLALLYMDREDWEHAQRELKKCIDVDKNNTLALRYIKEVEKMLAPDENTKIQVRKKKEEAVRYQSDNEIIIQPLNVKEPGSVTVPSFVNLALGILIGIGVMYFLVVPSVRSNVNNEAQKNYTELANQMDSKTQMVQELESDNEKLNAQIEELLAEVDSYVGTEGTLATIDNLLKAASAYVATGDVETTAANLEAIAEQVNIEETSDGFKELYNTLIGSIGPSLSNDYFVSGNQAYKAEDFEGAIEQYTKASFYAPENGDILYNLANAYRRSGDKDTAKELYEKIVEKYPDTEKARKANDYLAEMAN